MGYFLRKYFVVGYVGTHGMAHALENVLGAAERVRHTNARFLFVGAGARREFLLAEAERLELSNVIFVPPQPKEKMPSFWSLCDVALVHLRNIPLFETVIPSKMFEAMGMGLPVLLACPRGEASRILEAEQAGIWVPPEDPKALADAVELLNQNRDLLLRLGEASRFAAPRHSRERQAREYLTRLEFACGTPACRSHTPGDISVQDYTSRSM